MQGSARGELPEGDALANHLEAATVAVRNAYSECPNYDVLVPALLQHGTTDLAAHVHFVAGTPVKAMLAKPTNGVSEVLDRFSDCEFTCEYKYDGERAQVRRICTPLATLLHAHRCRCGLQTLTLLLAALAATPRCFARCSIAAC